MIGVMGTEPIIKKDYFYFQYRNQYVRGVLGRLESPLEEIDDVCKTEQLEFAPVKVEAQRDFLAGFCFSPIIDITIDKCRNNEASIVAYSLDNDRSAKVIDYIIKKAGFEVQEPELEFMATVGHEFDIEKHSYDLAEQISGYLNGELEKVWGAIRYINFLQLYRRCPQEESMQTAIKKFELPEDAFKRKKKKKI